MGKVLVIEPYYGGSHKAFHDQLISSFHSLGIETLEITMKPRHWRWRIQGSHFFLAERIQAILYEHSIDFIWTCSLVDVCALKGLLKSPPQFLTFFHEHQLAYPLKERDQSEIILRDHFLPGIHASQLMASELNLFSSSFNRESLKVGLKRFFSSRPEKSEFCFDNFHTSLCHLPLEGEFFNELPFKNRPRRLLWNHRWEYDKGPEEFKLLVEHLSQKEVDFELDLLGEPRGDIFLALKKLDANKTNFSLNSYGGPTEASTYRKRLGMCRILPVTSLHDFYGLSVREAILSGVIPILPNRMVYPECIPEELHGELLYNTFAELVEKTEKLLNKGLSEKNLGKLIEYNRKYSRAEFEKKLKEFIGLLNSV